MSKFKRNLVELAKTKISKSRNVIISRIEKDEAEGGNSYLVAQQMEVTEDGETFRVFIKGGSLKLASIESVVNLKKALEAVLDEEGYYDKAIPKHAEKKSDEDDKKKVHKKVKKHKIKRPVEQEEVEKEEPRNAGIPHNVENEKYEESAEQEEEAYEEYEESDAEEADEEYEEESDGYEDEYEESDEQDDEEEYYEEEEEEDEEEDGEWEYDNTENSEN